MGFLGSKGILLWFAFSMYGPQLVTPPVAADFETKKPSHGIRKKRGNFPYLVDGSELRGCHQFTPAVKIPWWNLGFIKFQVVIDCIIAPVL